MTMPANSPVLYDRSTDTMYVTLREGRVAHTVAHDERDLAVDIGEDGEPGVVERSAQKERCVLQRRLCRS